MSKTIDKKEIEKLGRLIKIDLKEPDKYVSQVEKILNYFENLDTVKIDSDKILTQEIHLENLRNDEHVSYDENLINGLKHTRENFVKSPKI